MGQLHPFRAYRYDAGTVGRIEDVVTQPYDKITPDMLENYLKRHPANIARVTKNSNYAEAAGCLDQWIRDGTLRQDTKPSFYPCQQVFSFNGQTCSRLGFIGLVSLDDADLAVKGHENILQAPLEDRLNLMRATESNQGLIFMLYSDSSLRVDRLLADFAENHQPLLEVGDEHQVRHRLWQLSDPEVQEGIASALRALPLYIADGHHRFHTSVLYRRECLDKRWKPAAVESFDKRMLALFNMEGSGLKILPTHRAIRNLSEFYLAELLSNVERFFSIEKLSSLEELDAAMKEAGHRIGLVVAQPFRIYVLRLRGSARDDSSFMPEIYGPARHLDVHILHEGILRPFLGVGAEELSTQRYVDYYRERDEMIERLKEKQYQLAFLLNPTTLEQVKEISERGEKMPQKSTDFYPKLLTGLVLMKMEILKGT